MINCTRKLSLTSNPMGLSFVTMFIISMTCWCMVHEPSNLMVVKVPINIQKSDISEKSSWERSSTNFIYSLVLLVLGIMNLMLFVVAICMNIRFSLFDLSQGLWKDLCSSLLESIIAIGFSIWSVKSRFRTFRWN